MNLFIAIAETAKRGNMESANRMMVPRVIA